MPIQSCQIKGTKGFRWGKSGKCFTGARARARAKRQGRAIEASISSNRQHGPRTRIVPSNPLKADPTRSATLRRKFLADVNKRFLIIKGLILRLIVDQDIFGLKLKNRLTENVDEYVGERETGTARGRAGQGAGEVRDDIRDIGQESELLQMVDSGSIDVGLVSSNGVGIPYRVSELGAIYERIGSRAEEVNNSTEGTDRGPRQDDRDARQADQGAEGSTAESSTESTISNLDIFSWGNTNGDGLPIPVVNTRWRARSTPEQVRLFQQWLERQLNNVIDVGDLKNVDDAWFQKYVEEGYRKGAGRAFDDTRQAALFTGREGDFFRGTKAEFLRQSFGSPVAINKVKLLSGRVLTDLKNVNTAMATVISRELTDGLVQGKNPLDIARSINKLGLDDIGIRRSRTIARTEIIRAHAEGQLDALEAMGIEEVETAVEFSTSGDDRVCPRCQPMEGVILKVKEARGVIPLHPECLPGNSFVLPRSRVSAVSKRWFDGDFIVIKTATGLELTCTPNHPILTDSGWLPANNVNTLSKVICDGGSEWKRLTNTNDDNVPSMIHHVAESFFGSSQVSTVPVPVTTEDFHNDGMDGQVAIVGTDRSLCVSPDVSLFQRISNAYFKFRNTKLSLISCFGSLNLFRERMLAASAGGVSSGNLVLTLDRSHRSPLDEFSFRGGSRLDSGPFKSGVDETTRDTQLACQLIAGRACEVFLDDVIDVNVLSQSCHVYNLETEDGWYSANGIITHNCRCAWIPANVGEDPKAKRTVHFDRKSPQQISKKRSRTDIKEAIDKSIKAEIPKRSKRTIAEQKRLGVSPLSDVRIAKRRPKSILDTKPRRRPPPRRKKLEPRTPTEINKRFNSTVTQGQETPLGPRQMTKLQGTLGKRNDLIKPSPRPTHIPTKPKQIVKPRATSVKADKIGDISKEQKRISGEVKKLNVRIKGAETRKETDVVSRLKVEKKTLLAQGRQIGKESADRLVGAANNALDDMVERFPAIRNLEDVGRKANVNISEGFAGSRTKGDFRLKTGEIRIKGSLDLSSKGPQFGKWDVGSGFEDTLRHEYGHRYFWDGSKTGERSSWKRLANSMSQSDKAKLVSQYGASSSEELFAESFSAFTNPKYVKGSLPKPIESFLQESLGVK